MNAFLQKPVQQLALFNVLAELIEGDQSSVSARASASMIRADQATDEFQMRQALGLMNEDVQHLKKSLMGFYGKYYSFRTNSFQLDSEDQQSQALDRLRHLRGQAAKIGAYQLRDAVNTIELLIHDQEISQAYSSYEVLLSQLQDVLEQTHVLLESLLQTEKQSSIHQTFDALQDRLTQIQLDMDRFADSDHHTRSQG